MWHKNSDIVDFLYIQNPAIGAIEKEQGKNSPRPQGLGASKAHRAQNLRGFLK